MKYNAQISRNIENIRRCIWYSDSRFVTTNPIPPSVEIKKKLIEEQPTQMLENVPKIAPEIVTLLNINLECFKIKIFKLINKPIKEAVIIDIMKPITASLGR